MNRSVGHGTFGGILLGVFPSLLLGDVLKTILLAIVGAVVSFCVSLVLARFSKGNK